MQLSKLSMVVLFVITTKCQTEIIITSSSSDESTSRLVADVVKIVTSCYGDRIYGVGLDGNLPDALSRTLSARHLIPVTLIDHAKKVDNDDRMIEDVGRVTDKYIVPEQCRRKLPVFILEASSWQELMDIATLNIGHTIWSNHMASVFILDRSPDCVNARQFLTISWKLDLLHAKVMCCHPKSERIIVSYNPFTSAAPLPWQRVGVFKEHNRHPFVLFSRKYGESENICVDLDFDKTKDLGGYEITVEGLPLGNNARMATDLSEYRFWTINDRILNTVYHAMNATPKFTGLERWNDHLNVDMKKKNLFISEEWHYRVPTYPHQQGGGYIIVSHFRTRKSQPNGILPNIEIGTRFSLGVVYFMTLVFFKFFIHQPLMPAFLNLIRITCNTGFTNLPHNNTSRIYLTGLLLFAVVVLGIYQGHLAFLLTTRTPPRNVDTMADIAQLNYKKIYGIRDDRYIFEDSDLENRYVWAYDSNSCFKFVRRDASAVCMVWAGFHLADKAQELGLHVSSESVSQEYIVFEIRQDWPLEQRINVIIAKLVEGNLHRPFDVRCNPKQAYDFHFTHGQRNMLGKNKIFEKIDLGELTCAFVILGIGLAFATIAFIGELAIEYKCRIVRRRIVNRHV